MSTPQTIQVSVLRWAPPFAQGLVRELRVRWALEEAGLPYREHLLDRADQSSAAYRALQPFGQVPAFQGDGLALFESGAIVLHIAEQSPALLPREPSARAQAVSWLFAVLNTIEMPIWMHNFMEIMELQGQPQGAETKALRASVVSLIERHLDTLVRVLEGKDYLLDRFTAADLLLTTVLRILRTTDLVEARPPLRTYQQRCEARPAFQKALSDHMANFERHTPAGK